MPGPTVAPKIGIFVCSAVTLIFVLSAVWLVVDFNFAKTFLATPLNPTVLWAASIFGAVAGGCVVALDHARNFTRYNAAMPQARSTIVVVIMSIVFAIFGVLVANMVAPRVANVYLFWNSDAPIVRKIFPIREVLPRKGTFAVSVGLQGEGRRLQISRKDYDLLGGKGELKRPWVYCLSLQEQREGEAIRVWRPEHSRADFEGVTVVRCPDAVRLVD